MSLAFSWWLATTDSKALRRKVKEFLAWARNILAACDGLQAEAASCKGALVGRLRIGAVPLASVDPVSTLLTPSQNSTVHYSFPYKHIAVSISLTRYTVTSLTWSLLP